MTTSGRRLGEGRRAMLWSAAVPAAIGFAFGCGVVLVVELIERLSS